MIDSKKLIKEYALTPNKALGQNFLVDENALAAIARLARHEGKTVLEIGPGLGALTCALASSARRVVAVEIDSKLCAVLEKVLACHSNIELINKDFLKLSSSELEELLAGGAVVCANLPYYITTDCALKLIDAPLPIERMVLMMQLEAAAHFTAAPKMKCYTAVSVLAQRYFSIASALELGPSSYLPEPAVHSAVLVFERNDTVYEREFSRLVKAAFQMRRKTLRNNLPSVLPRELVPAAIEMAGLPASCRAEELSVDDFNRLFASSVELRSGNGG